MLDEYFPTALDKEVLQALRMLIQWACLFFKKRIMTAFTAVHTFGPVSESADILFRYGAVNVSEFLEALREEIYREFVARYRDTYRSINGATGEATKCGNQLVCILSPVYFSSLSKAMQNLTSLYFQIVQTLPHQDALSNEIVRMLQKKYASDNTSEEIHNAIQIFADMEGDRVEAMAIEEGHRRNVASARRINKIHASQYASILTMWESADADQRIFKHITISIPQA